MPNWCSNSEVIVGPKKEIKNLYKNLAKWLDEESHSIWSIAHGAKLDDLDCGRGIIVDPFEMSVDSTDENIAYITFVS